MIWQCVHVKNKQNKWTLYKDNEDDDYYILTAVEQSKINYILGADKFPLPENKNGLLNDKLDKLFNINSSKNRKGALNQNSSIFLRD